MKMLKMILIVILVLAVAVIGFLAYMGALTEPKISEMKTGPYLFVYEEFVGPYKDTGAIFDKVYKSLKADGIEVTDGIGLYFDDPSKVPADKLRSHCGAIITHEDLSKLYKAGKKFKVGRVPARNSIVVEFPIRNSMSYMVAPIKGYPALMKYLKEKNYKMAMPYEYYDMTNGKILIIMEIKKQGQTLNSFGALG